MDVLGIVFTASACLIMGLMILTSDVTVNRFTHRLALILVALPIAGSLAMAAYVLTH